MESFVLQIRTLIAAHVKKEEEALYPLAEQVLDAATLNKLREEMERRKTELREVVKT